MLPSALSRVANGHCRRDVLYAASRSHQLVRGLHAWRRPAQLTSKVATALRSQLRLRHGLLRVGSQAPGKLVILRAFGLSAAITAGSFGAVAILDSETPCRRFRSTSDLAMYASIGVLALVFATSRLVSKQRVGMMERWLVASTVAFRPAQVLGATLYHASVFHLACNCWALAQLYRLPMADVHGCTGSFPVYSLAVMLSCGAWVVLARFCLYTRLMAALRQPRCIVQSCGASCGLMAILGCHSWDTRPRFRVLLTDITLSPAQLATFMAGIDVTLLVLRSLRLYASRMDHVGHLLGLGAGVVMSNEYVASALLAYKKLAVELWLRARPYVMR